MSALATRMLNFEHQEVLVIGGSSGIGFATARLAAALGAHVTIASRSTEKVSAAAKSLGPGVVGRTVDVTDDESVAALFSDGRTWDHVIVTASEVKVAPVRELPLQTARAAFDSKYWGFYRLARAARIAATGSLEVVAGFLATRPVAGRALMGSINAALEALVRGLALELRPVRVNAVSPAIVDTAMWSAMTAADREAMMAKAAATYPAGVVGTADDIARQLLLLAGTRYATGTIVTLDGGASLV